MKILLIDDSRFVRFTVKKHLETSLNNGETYYEAASGQEGLTVFEQVNPDLVILDLLMPDIGGEEVLTEIRKKDASCFIVILTSNFQKPVKKRLLSLGANLFVEKTISLEKISSIIDSYREHK